MLDQGLMKNKPLLTFELFENTFHGAGASATGHSHIELVLMFRHGGNFGGVKEGRFLAGRRNIRQKVKQLREGGKEKIIYFLSTYTNTAFVIISSLYEPYSSLVIDVLKYFDICIYN
jgi:hypothetical protein